MRLGGIARQAVLTVLFAVAAATLWLIWFIWPVQLGLGSRVPAAVWMIGFAVSAIVLMMFACRNLHPAVVCLAVPAAFTLGFALTLVPADSTGLSRIGLMLVGLASFTVIPLVVLVYTGIRSETSATAK
ncbi:hypothetical protein [Arthrobacter monumenti]